MRDFLCVFFQVVIEFFHLYLSKSDPKINQNTIRRTSIILILESSVQTIGHRPNVLLIGGGEQMLLPTHHYVPLTECAKMLRKDCKKIMFRIVHP